jgi:hypothetical protein
LRRALEFGYSLPNYLTESPPPKGFNKIDAVVGEHLYSYDADRFSEMGKRHSLDYVVIKKDLLKNRVFLPVTYENEFFVIHEFTVSGAAPASRARVQ